MAVIERPDSIEGMVYQLWFAIIGSNGDGLASQVRDTRERVEKIEDTLPTLWTREDHDRAEAKYAIKDKAKTEAAREGKERRRMSRREVLSLAFAGIGTLTGVCGVLVALAALK